MGGGVSCVFQDDRSKTGLGVGGCVASNRPQADISRTGLTVGCDVGGGVGCSEGEGDGGFAIGCIC